MENVYLEEIEGNMGTVFRWIVRIVGEWNCIRIISNGGLCY
jgi:hypothetical protein